MRGLGSVFGGKGEDSGGWARKHTLRQSTARAGGRKEGRRKYYAAEIKKKKNPGASMVDGRLGSARNVKPISGARSSRSDGFV